VPHDQDGLAGDFKLFINGMLVKGASTLNVINRATGKVLTVAPRADMAQLEEAVAAAKTHFTLGPLCPFEEEEHCCSSWPMSLKEVDSSLPRSCPESRQAIASRSP
jgi:hypothetical protein